MKTDEKRRGLDYYLGLKYPVRVIQYPEGDYFAEIPDLPGCMTEADTLEDLFKMIEEARQDWLEMAVEDGIDIKIPETERKFSGKFMVRIPKSVHAHLSRRADEEKVSLNQYISYLLAFNSGQDQIGALKKDIEDLKRSVNDLSSEFRKKVPFSLEENIKRKRTA